MGQSTSGSFQPNGHKSIRTVSVLTPEQRAHKRARDRDAQRAIRARTKTYIETLKREIEKLLANNHEDTMVEKLIQRNKAIEEEIAELRKLSIIHNSHRGS
ncbi:hypothetical protein JX265_013684 [Neoarthrinium moseri]|uniref:BZIP domain-containing protein n=1 Tax=Neoarthrinium moseri TaxID=1658444 RepID=A0A9P9W894_9PEZI|nr:hypothetical protein JX265_013684 [Neoarthrinium moseri]